AVRCKAELKPPAAIGVGTGEDRVLVISIVDDNVVRLSAVTREVVLVVVGVAGAVAVDVREPAALRVQDDVVELRVAGRGASGNGDPIELDGVVGKKRGAKVGRREVESQRAARG